LKTSAFVPGFFCLFPARTWDSKESALFSVLDTWIEAARFSADVHRVIALRMIRLASGGPKATIEAREMVSEKVSAFVDAHVAVITALSNGSSLEEAAAGAYAPYRRCVQANSCRLGS